MAVNYCENDYLHKENHALMNEVMDERYNYSELKRKNLFFERERIEEYYKFINLISKLIYELGIKDNSISYSILISTLAHHGYFSIKKPENLESKYNMTSFFGIDLVAGNCCCRHFAFFHKDIFDKLGQFDFLLPCVIDAKTPSNVAANHIVNGIRYNDNMYIYDSYNEILFGLINEFKMQSICSKYKKTIYYKPYADMIISGVSIEEERRRVEVLRAISTLPKISQDELDYIVNETVRNAKLHQDTLSDFKEESKEYIKRILK